MRIRFPVIVWVALTTGATGCRGEDSTAGATELESLAADAPVVRNGRGGVWDSASAWRLSETLRIGSAEGTGPDLFGEVTDLAVDELGRVFVLDRHAHEIRSFGPDGTHVRTFGREGGGPGELQDPIALAWGPAGRLWVVDPGNARYAVFDTAGRYLEEHHRPSNSYSVPWPGGFGDDGRLYDHVFLFKTGEPNRDGLVRYDRAFQPADTLWLPWAEDESFELTKENSRVKANVPFTSNLIWRFDPRGFVWLAETGKYRVYEQRLDGGAVRVIEKEYDPVPVAAEEKQRAVENLDWFRRQGGKIDPSRIPDEKPALETFFVDPAGYLWVYPTATADSVIDVFDPSGGYLGHPSGHVRLDRYPPPVFTADAIYGVTRDTLEVPYVVRLDVIRR